MPRYLQKLNLSGTDGKPDDDPINAYPWWAFLIEGLIVFAIVLGILFH